MPPTHLRPATSVKKGCSCFVGKYCASSRARHAEERKVCKRLQWLLQGCLPASLPGDHSLSMKSGKVTLQ